MAEGVAVLGLVSSIVSLIEFGGKVANRLREFSVKTGEIPESFRVVSEQLPLLLITLQQIQTQEQSGRLEATTAKALEPIIDSTLKNTKCLEVIIAKFLPDEQRSTLRRRMEALRSLSLDDEVANHLEKLKGNIQLLVFHQTTQTFATTDEILKAISQLQVRSPDANQANQQQVSALSMESVFMVPFRRDKNFVHREVLDDIGRQLEQPNSRVGLVGLGGCGKTQIAIEYAYRARDDAPKTAIFWIHAGSTSRIRQDFASIAERLEIPGRGDPNADIVGLTCRRLSAEANSKWLLVIDNADDPRVISGASDEKSGSNPDIKPQSLAANLPVSDYGRALITSRSWDNVRRLVEYDDDIFGLGSLDTADAVKMFTLKLSRRVPPADAEDIEHLVKELECLPLAISHAAALINQRAPRMSVAKYLNAFRNDDQARQQLLSLELPDARRNLTIGTSVFSTFQISFQTIRELYRTAADLLSYISMFDRSGVPESLLTGHYLLEESMAQDSSLKFADDIAILQSYDLVHFQENGSIGMHGLVQLATKDWLECNHTITRWQGCMIKTLSEVVPKPDVQTWKEWLILLPHIKSMESFKPSKTETDLCTKWAGILWHEFFFLLQHSKFTEAEAIPRLYLEAFPENSGHKSKEQLRGHCLMAMMAIIGGKFKEAAAILDDVIPALTAQFGHEDADARAALIMKSRCLMQDGKFPEAERVLDTIINSPAYTGINDMAECCDAEQYLAQIYTALGDFDKAMKILESAVAKTILVLGNHHPETLSIRVNQSVLMYHQRRYAETEAFLRDLYEAASQHLDLDHPVFLGLRNTMSAAMFYLGRTKEAQDIQKELLERSERVAGPSSPQTLLAMRNYAAICLNTGEYDIGINWLRQAIETQEQLSGPESLETLTLKFELAKGLALTDADEEESQLYEEVRKGFERQPELGRDILLQVKSSQANRFATTGRLHEALELSQSVVAQSRQLGRDGSHTIDILVDLAFILCKNGDVEQGEQAFHEARMTANRLRGGDGNLEPGTEQRWISQKRLAEAKRLLEKGDLNKAQEMFDEGLAAKLAANGVTDPDKNLNTRKYKADFEACKEQAIERRFPEGQGAS